jgi:hypothetical protein
LEGGKERVNALILHAIREVSSLETSFTAFQHIGFLLIFFFWQWVQKQMLLVLQDMPEQDRLLDDVQLQCAYMNYQYFNKSPEAGRMISESLEARKKKVRSFYFVSVHHLFTSSCSFYDEKLLTRNLVWRQ